LSIELMEPGFSFAEVERSALVAVSIALALDPL
jgi:hypothetical protein